MRKSTNIESIIGNAFSNTTEITGNGVYNTYKLKDYDGADRFFMFTTIPSTGWKIGLSNTFKCL